jgi:hypothetical protein
LRKLNINYLLRANDVSSQLESSPKKTPREQRGGEALHTEIRHTSYSWGVKFVYALGNIFGFNRVIENIFIPGENLAYLPFNESEDGAE